MAAPQHAPGEAPQTFDPVPFSRDEPKTIFLLTSLSSGSSTIITATSRLEHILNSNKVPFKAVDLATDDKARRLWQWKGKGKRLPGVAKDGEVLGNYEDIEDWNEHGELRQNLGVSKKKKKTGMDGTTVRPNPSRTATPNIVAPREPPSSTPAGGVPTAFSQANIASAAAAAGKKKAAGIKAAVTKVEGKKASSSTKKKEPAAAEKKEPATDKKEPITEKKEPVAEKKDPVTEKKAEPVTEAKEKPAADTPKSESVPTIAKKEEPVTDKDVGEEKVEALKTSVEKLKLQDEKEKLVPGDEESKAPAQTPAEK